MPIFIAVNPSARHDPQWNYNSKVDSTTLLILLVVFFATLIRSTFGFGEALVAVPLLALVIPIEIAAPLAVLLSITVAAVVVAQD